MSSPTSPLVLSSPPASGSGETIAASPRGEDRRYPARLFRTALLLGVFACAGLVVGWSGPYTKLVLLLPLALLAAGASSASLAKLAAAGALALAWVALPASIHQGIELGGGTITLYLSDVALLVAVAAVCSRHSISRLAAVSIAPFAMVVLFMLGLAFLNGSTLKASVMEVRSPLYLVGGFLVAAGLAAHCTDQGNRRLLAAVMWVSAAMTVGAATWGFPLNGRVETVHSTSGLRWAWKRHASSPVAPTLPWPVFATCSRD